jgi:uncharacterized membrane protein YfhO
MSLIVLVSNYYSDRNDEKETLEAQTALIEKQVRNVSKLKVTEATYAKAYENNKIITVGEILQQSKRASLYQRSGANRAMTLRLMRYEIDEFKNY